MEGDERQSVWRPDTEFDKLASTTLPESMTNVDVEIDHQGFRVRREHRLT
jgi:hypothetical protein